MVVKTVLKMVEATVEQMTVYLVVKKVVEMADSMVEKKAVLKDMNLAVMTVD